MTEMSAIGSSATEDSRIEVAISTLQRKIEEVSKTKPEIVKDPPRSLELIWQRYLLHKDPSLNGPLNPSEVSLQVSASFNQFKQWWNTVAVKNFAQISYFQARVNNGKDTLTVFHSTEFPTNSRIPDSHCHLFYLYFELYFAHFPPTLFEEISSKIKQEFREFTAHSALLPSPIRAAVSAHDANELRDASPVEVATKVVEKDPIFQLINRYTHAKEAIEKRDTRAIVTSLTQDHESDHQPNDDPLNTTDIDFVLYLNRQEDVDKSLKDFSRHLGSCGLDALQVFDDTLAAAKQESRQLKAKAAVYDSFIEAAQMLEPHVRSLVAKKRRISHQELQQIMEQSSQES